MECTRMCVPGALVADWVWALSSGSGSQVDLVANRHADLCRSLSVWCAAGWWTVHDVRLGCLRVIISLALACKVN